MLNWKSFLGKLSLVFTLILSAIWFYSKPDWEPAILFLSSFIGWILIEIKSDTANEKEKSHDSKLYSEFLNLLPTSEIEYMMKNHDFGGSFNFSDLNPIKEFLYTWNNAEHEFINRKLEKYRKTLLNSIDEFWGSSAGVLFPIDSNDRVQLYPDFKYDHKNKYIYEEARSKLNEQASQIYLKHQEFIRTANKILKINYLNTLN